MWIRTTNWKTVRRPSNDYAHFHFPPPLLDHSLVYEPPTPSSDRRRQPSSPVSRYLSTDDPGELVSAIDFERFETIFCLRLNVK
ncbi:hypothetical protein K7X08_031748 [Anisodus acutangulus]|uniref:Uncharacterized protein n=1 Tax=Anisodus acutangulus TaxID=402998 RepID=A0A9Q1MM87_9SOLA|nr:hypothetical protein K7X08_031748 [Anisodus acutangulus]